METSLTNVFSTRRDNRWQLRPFVVVLVVMQLCQVVVARNPTSSASTTTTAALKFWWRDKRRESMLHGMLKSIPALSQNRNPNFILEDRPAIAQETALKVKKSEPQPKFPLLSGVNPSFFLGITPQTMKSLPSSNKLPQKKRVDLREGMSEALDELRSMRREMEQMRKEIATLKQLQMGDDYVDHEAAKVDLARQQRKRQREFEQVAVEVERWAEEILFPQSTDEDKVEGWAKVPCHNMFKSKFNRNDHTRAYLKWMKDSRGSSSATKMTNEKQNEQEWPCIRIYSTIEAPPHEVSAYLSQEEHAGEYNQLIDQHRDLEEITPHSKICWAQSPQLLFIKPRDFVTFCSHRWRRDGTQVVVNQACDHFDGVTANAFALRGATFIGPDPDDSEKTSIAMIAHASPGKDIPAWACKTAIQSLAPIEPYRLFHKINEGVKHCREELQVITRRLDEAEMVGSNNGRTSRFPAGLAQMGYACFWPEGGGEKEGFVTALRQDDNTEEPLVESDVAFSVND